MPLNDKVAYDNARNKNELDAIEALKTDSGCINGYENYVFADQLNRKFDINHIDIMAIMHQVFPDDEWSVCPISINIDVKDIKEKNRYTRNITISQSLYDAALQNKLPSNHYLMLTYYRTNGNFGFILAKTYDIINNGCNFLEQQGDDGSQYYLLNIDDVMKKCKYRDLKLKSFDEL